MADNNTLRKDLGPVTAYAIAVEAGFEGTQEEWVRRISSSVDQQSFDTLAASVESGDATLSNKIDNDIGAEAEARSAADTAEAAARSAADTAEATARETADTALSGRIDALSETVAGNDTTLRNILVHKPADSYSPDGSNGQVLMTHGDGTTEWSSFGQPTPEQAAAAVSAWLDAHPEATTTVVDGSITKAKLDSELKDRVNLATNSLAPIFQQATANDPGTYVSIADRLYYLPEGHTADVTWENTTKVEVQTTSEIKNLSDDVSELKSALNSIAGQQITQVTATKDSTKLTVYPTRGYINSANGELYPNNNYQIYYYTVNAEGNVWFESNTDFCQFAVYRGTILTTSSLQVLYKNDSANFPLSANKYSALQVGDIVAICIQVGSSKNFTYHFPFYEGYLLNDDTVENIGERLEIEEIEASISSQANGITDLKNSIIEMPTHNKHIIWADDGVTANNNSGYDSTYLIDVQIGSKIIYNTNIPSGYHALLFYDGDGVIAGTYGTNQNGNDFVYVVEDSTYKYVRYQSRNLNFSGNTISPSIKIYQPIINLIAAVKSPLYLMLISATEFHIKVPCKSGKYVRYVFRHDYKKWDSLEYQDGDGNTQTATNVVSCDLWNNYEVYNDTDNTYIAQGNTNFIVERGNHYIGDGHGNEVEVTFAILADGKEIDLTSMRPGQSLVCGEIRIISKSKMYRFGGNTGSDVPAKAYPAIDTSGNPIVELLHCMDISYSYNNVVKWSNKIVVQNDNISFGCCLGAMLECYFADFDTVIIDNAESTQNDIASDGTVTVPNGSTIDLHVPGNNTQFASTVEMFGKKFYIKQAMKNVDASTRSKQAVAFSFYADRLKAYFAPVRTTSRYPSGYSADVFNSGDVIAVENERIIEI